MRNSKMYFLSEHSFQPFSDLVLEVFPISSVKPPNRTCLLDNFPTNHLADLV